jgi:hypothetical protein
MLDKRLADILRNPKRITKEGKRLGVRWEIMNDEEMAIAVAHIAMNLYNKQHS